MRPTLKISLHRPVRLALAPHHVPRLANEKISCHRPVGLGAVRYHDLGAESDHHDDGSDLAAFAERLAPGYFAGHPHSGLRDYSDFRGGVAHRLADPQRIWPEIMGGLREGHAARPFVGNIYKGVKQVSDTLLSGSGNSFRKVLLVRYPHPDAWSLAFQTNVPNDVVSRFDEEYVAVFIPTTPSPVNGFYFFVRRADTIVLDMTVDVALRSIVSMGVVSDTPSAIPSSPTLS